MSQDSIAPVIDFLRRHAPFDQMAPAHMEYMAKRLKLGFYPKGKVITGPQDGPANRFFIIKQGRTRGELEKDELNETGAWELMSGECFPIGALLSRRPVRNRHRAVEDTFCYELERKDFETLLNQSPVFHDFCTRRLASLLDSALHRVQASQARRMSEATSLNTPLNALLRRTPVTCSAETPLQEALHRMEAEHVGSIVVVDEAERPVGVFTLHDVLSRVALPRRDLTVPMGEVMTREPLTLPPTALAYEAALVMAQHGFGHICVVNDGKLAGVLSERDLFSLQRIGLVNLSRSIARATEIETLAALGPNIHHFIGQMLAQGASVEQLTQIIATLNDGLTRRVIDLIIEQEGEPEVPFTWLSFGSEGRHEQTLKTDQDNGILFEPPPGKRPEDVRALLLPLAKKINDALDRCGFPLCKGGVMASNPECCLSFDEWRSRFDRWIDQGTPQHLLNATIYFDFRPLWGDPAPARRLRDWLKDPVERNSRFRRQLAGIALGNRPPLGLIRDFKLSSGGKHPHTIDLKVQGITPFVDAARLYALASRIEETNTVARLREAVRMEVLRKADVDAWIEAYDFIQLLRMRTHRRQEEDGEPLSNHVDPDTLNELDRRILKESFRQARKFQSKIALEYQL